MKSKYFIIIFLLTLFNIKLRANNIDQESEAKYKVKNITDVNDLAHDLKNEILNSKTDLKISGATYYLSNNGNDANDGKSPEEAWATLFKVNNAELKTGDGVFFKRGELWRGSLHAMEGVTYSAYGQGEKPKILGSLQNYSIKLNWKKTGTPNVYYYDRPFEYDAGLIVFNDGEAHSIKKAAGIDEFSGLTTDLRNDLEMCHSITDKKIYLYSETVNPADRFSSIEFCLRDHIVKIFGDNVRIDNLCIKYGGAHGIRCLKNGEADCLNCNGLMVTNCEIGWIGGSLLREKLRYGNGIEIYGICKEYYVDHCYIYQIYDAAITHQYKDPTSTITKSPTVL